MRIYPAIDLKDGKCVRLEQGNFDKCTVYSDDPLTVAKNFKKAGADFIHIIDLDGARDGISKNEEAIKNIVEKVDIEVQTGGGIRTLENIERKINFGVSRVILGTIAVKNPEIVKKAIELYNDKIAVAIDAKNGYVATEGWEELSKIKASELAKKMKSYGLKTIIYTDISKDGMLRGVNLEETKEMCKIKGVDIIASGGISNIQDLLDVSKIAVEGCIVGKAIYNGNIDLKKAILLLR